MQQMSVNWHGNSKDNSQAKNWPSTHGLFWVKDVGQTIKKPSDTAALPRPITQNPSEHQSGRSRLRMCTNILGWSRFGPDAWGLNPEPETLGLYETLHPVS